MKEWRSVWRDENLAAGVTEDCVGGFQTYRPWPKWRPAGQPHASDFVLAMDAAGVSLTDRPRAGTARDRLSHLVLLVVAVPLKGRGRLQNRREEAILA
jgi:hypothetical protein